MSTVVFVVEFLTSVNLTENATLATAVGDPLSGTTYTVKQLISIIPSGISIYYISVSCVNTFNIAVMQQLMYALVSSENAQIPAPANLVLVNLFLCVLVPLVAHVTLEHAK